MNVPFPKVASLISREICLYYKHYCSYIILLHPLQVNRNTAAISNEFKRDSNEFDGVFNDPLRLKQACIHIKQAWMHIKQLLCDNEM